MTDHLPAPAASEGQVVDLEGPRDISAELAAMIDRSGAETTIELAGEIVEWLAAAGNTLGGDDPGVWGMKVFRNIVERRNAELRAEVAERQLARERAQLAEAMDVVQDQSAEITRLRETLT